MTIDAVLTSITRHCVDVNSLESSWTIAVLPFPIAMTLCAVMLKGLPLRLQGLGVDEASPVVGSEALPVNVRPAHEQGAVPVDELVSGDVVARTVRECGEDDPVPSPEPFVAAAQRTKPSTEEGQ